jgi:hypothetical protein
MPAERGILREILIVEQNNPALKRRWFESDYFDLFTWQDLSGTFVKFQLCYDVERNERALVWSQPGGFHHDGVDHGEGEPGHPQTPILVADGKLDSGTVAPRFKREAADIPAEVSEFILAKIREHLIERHRAQAGRKRVRRERWQQRKAEPKAAPEN